MPSMVTVSRELLAVDLRTYGEEELAGRISGLTDVEMQRIGERAFDHSVTGMLIARHSRWLRLR